MLTGQHPKLRDSASAASSIGIASVLERIALVRYNAARLLAFVLLCLRTAVSRSIDAEFFCAVASAFKKSAPLGRPPQFLISAHDSGPNSPACCEFLKGDS